MPIPKIKKLLIANRGEIACKIIRCARKMKIPTVAIYSDEDVNCLHAKLADEAINIPGSLVSETYMNSDVIIKICKKYKINAIHPGYGLLSENADFVRMVENNNLIFIGPSSKIVRNMGEKDKAKLIMEKAGIPVVPGYHGKIQDKQILEQTPKKIEYKFKLPILEQFYNQSHPLYASARMWDDGIIDPTKTRDILAASIKITMNQSIEDTKFGIFRM